MQLCLVKMGVLISLNSLYVLLKAVHNDTGGWIFQYQVGLEVNWITEYSCVSYSI